MACGKKLSGVHIVPENTKVFHLIIRYFDEGKWKQANVPYHVTALTKASARLKVLYWLKLNYNTSGQQLKIEVLDITDEDNRIII